MFNNIKAFFSKKQEEEKDFATLCREHNIKYSTAYIRLNKLGWSKEDIFNPVKKYKKNPVAKYDKNFARLCKEAGVSYNTAYYRHKVVGASLEESLSTTRFNKKKEKVLDTAATPAKEKSLAALCGENDINYELVRKRVKNGWEVQDALTCREKRSVRLSVNLNKAAFNDKCNLKEVLNELPDDTTAGELSHNNFAVGKFKVTEKKRSLKKTGHLELMREHRLDIDSLVGKTFNRLTIIKAFREKCHWKGNTGNMIYVHATCSCGEGVVKKYYFNNLLTGITKSCGCVLREYQRRNIVSMEG